MSRPKAPLMFAVAATSILVLGGCIVVDADEGDLRTGWDSDHVYGRLMGADIGANAVTVRVSSNGCTTKDFIGTNVRRLDEDRFSVGFYRDKEDYCDAAMPEGVALSWSFAELGIPAGAEVRVRNAVGS